MVFLWENGDFMVIQWDFSKKPARCRGLLCGARGRGGPAVCLARAAEAPGHGAAGGAADGRSHPVAKFDGEAGGELRKIPWEIHGKSHFSTENSIFLRVEQCSGG